MTTQDFIDLVRRMRQEQKSVCGYMRRELEQEVDNELSRLMGEQERQRQIEAACNTDCVAYVRGFCPYVSYRKQYCERFRIVNGL